MIEHLNIAASAAVGGGQVGQIGYKEIFQRRLRFVAVEKCVDIIFGKEIRKKEVKKTGRDCFGQKLPVFYTLAVAT